MGRRLLLGIMNPAMLVAWAAGLALMVNVEAWTEAWLHAKATAVIVLTVLHMTAARWRRDFAADANRHSERFYRIMNEVPALLMVAIVIFVVVRPFYGGGLRCWRDGLPSAARCINGQRTFSRLAVRHRPIARQRAVTG